MPLNPKIVADAITDSGSGKNAKLSDGRNLYLVARRGRGFWVYQFRDGVVIRSKGLGPAADVTLAAARRSREDFAAARRRELAGGVTMAGIRPQAGPGVLFKDAAREYIETQGPKWTANHKAGLDGLLKNYAGPLDAKPVNTITTINVRDMLKPIWNGPGDNRGSRLRRLVEAILSANDVDPNPAAWVRLKGKLLDESPKSTPKKAMPFADVPAFVATLGDDTESRATQFVILTAVRRKEALGALWQEFDFANRVWHVPAGWMKEKIAHDVPLTDEMIACIGKPGDAKAFVFPAPRTGGMLSHHACSMLEHGYTLHGFRTSFSTWAQAQDEGRAYPNTVIEAALAHKLEDKVAAAYLRHNHFAARVKLMAAWSAFAMGN
jgi:integrase